MPGESQSWFFGCSRCGKCCNSAPRLTVPELFHHQARFVGCLGLRRLGKTVELFTQALSPLPDRCPALSDNGSCIVHADRKPIVCSVVPLDATLPDAEQHAVLNARRGEAEFWGADCIRASPAPGLRELTRRLRVVDPEAFAALGRYRQSLADEERHWGAATARVLGPDLLDHPERVASLPEHGVVTMALVPVLSVLARASERCHARVAQYLRAQLVLQDRLLSAELGQGERRLLSALREHNRRFAAALGTSSVIRASTVAPIEAWLDLS